MKPRKLRLQVETLTEEVRALRAEIAALRGMLPLAPPPRPWLPWLTPPVWIAPATPPWPGFPDVYIGDVPPAVSPLTVGGVTVQPSPVTLTVGDALQAESQAIFQFADGSGVAVIDTQA